MNRHPARFEGARLGRRLRERLRVAATRRAWWSGTVLSVESQDPVVALTFDDGPDPEVTPGLLDVLAAHGARASFFLLGERVGAHKDLVDRIRRDGHEVGTHTWSHRSLVLEAPSGRIRTLIWYWRQLQRGREATQPAARIIRPPYGHETVGVRCVALALRLRTIGWSVGADDYQGDDGSVIATRVRSQMQAGSIVLFHDWLAGAAELTYLDRRPTLEAVERVLETPGFRFVTVSELLDAGTPRLRFFPPRPSTDLASLKMQESAEISKSDRPGPHARQLCRDHSSAGRFNRSTQEAQPVSLMVSLYRSVSRLRP
jgi:peptidoglycan/xylan/chitin deacetylase (PgdA/CDA1 family)